MVLKRRFTRCVSVVVLNLGDCVLYGPACPPAASLLAGVSSAVTYLVREIAGVNISASYTIG